MYGLPENADMTFLIAKDLLQICFGQNEMILNFSEDVRICVMSVCDIATPLGKADHADKYSEYAVMLCSFIGRSISAVQPDSSGTLRLKFGNEYSLVLFDDSKEYESYQITASGKTVIV